MPDLNKALRQARIIEYANKLEDELREKKNRRAVEFTFEPDGDCECFVYSIGWNECRQLFGDELFEMKIAEVRRYCQSEIGFGVYFESNEEGYIKLAREKLKQLEEKKHSFGKFIQKRFYNYLKLKEKRKLE